MNASYLSYRIYTLLLISICLPNLIAAQNQVLTKVNGGASWANQAGMSITGGGATTVSGSYPNFTISSTGGTTYASGNNVNVGSNRIITNLSRDRVINITGSGGTTVTGTYPNYTISSSSGGYVAGSGISLANGRITNTAPDRTVSLTGAGGVTVTGTYPNFTVTGHSATPFYSSGSGISINNKVITNTIRDKNMTLTGAGGITVTGTYPNFTVSNKCGIIQGGVSYTPSSTESVLFANTAAGDITFNLPSPSSARGRVYTIIKTSSSNILRFNRAIQYTPHRSTTTYSGNVKLTIISNGTTWWKMED